MEKKQSLEETALHSRSDGSSSLQEIVEAVDEDVFTLLGNKKLARNPDFLKRPNHFFEGDYIRLFGDSVGRTGEVVEYSPEDFKVVAENYMAELANLIRPNIELSDTSLGGEGRRKWNKGSFRRNLPAFASTLFYSLGAVTTAFVGSGAALNFRYSTQTSYPLSREIEEGLRFVRGIPDGQSFFLWKENSLVQKLFSATKAIDEYLLNDSVVSHVGAVWPFLAAAAVVGGGLGYLRGRTKKEISQAQFRYKLLSDERAAINSGLLKNLTTPGRVEERANDYNRFNSVQ